MQQDILERWEEIKIMVESVDVDVRKNSKGVAAAGCRARRALRQLRKDIHIVIKQSIDQDKVKTEARYAARAKARSEA
jgi:hypothetical protein